MLGSLAVEVLRRSGPWRAFWYGVAEAMAPVLAQIAYREYKIHRPLPKDPPKRRRTAKRRGRRRAT